MAGMQAIGGTDRAHILRREQLAFLDVFDHKQGAAKLSARGFSRPGRELRGTQRFFRGAHRARHRLELLRLKRKSGIGSAVRATQTEMLFDDARAQRNSGDGHGSFHGVIGQARLGNRSGAPSSGIVRRFASSGGAG